ncbi:MAG: hypothetical protein IJE62_02000 [Clostridia bacterium]|nr:hypothetical protein [Clostridia bacterium]MBQ7095806.1 hypothetical protein [Clostridia bacterium]
MSRLKRGILIGAIILVAMLIIPLITIRTIKADAGMMVKQTRVIRTCLKRQNFNAFWLVEGL